MTKSIKPFHTSHGKVGDKLELSIESLAYGGKGIAKIGDFVIFVQNGLPQQKVLARIIKRRKEYAEAIVVDIVEESPLTISPKCEHFTTCGGCTFQHLNYNTQLEQKQLHVLDLYRRIGGIETASLDKVVPAENLFHFRNKMEFTFSNRRWILTEEEEGANTNFALGLHIPGRYDKILDINTCWIQKTIANEILQTVKEIAWETRLKPYDIINHTGFLRNLIIRIGEHTEEVMVNIVTSKEEVHLLQPIVDKLVHNFPQITSIVNNINRRKAGISFGEWQVTLHGLPYIHDELNGYTFEISANSFFQTNTIQAEKLYDIALEFADLTGDEVLYDLYCGTGSTSVFLASHVKQVYGFELISMAVEDAVQNAMSNKLDNCQFFEANLDTYFRITPILKEIEKPDVVLIDPPRAGIHPKLVKDIIQMKPEKVVYISCNPSTQARDAAMLCRGRYELKRLAMVDMFPHTPHIETIALLTMSGTK